MKTLKLSLEWIKLPDLPAQNNSPWQQGYAGPVAGALDEYLLVAGGANFLDNPPWKGGQKLYHDTIYLLEYNPEQKMNWVLSPQRLPMPMAYSACVSFPGGVVSIGGENPDGPISHVFLFENAGGSLKTIRWPDLPEALTSPSATILGSTLYVAGGTNGQGATKDFLCLDLDNPQSGWKNLAALPVPLSHGVLTAQWDGSETCIYYLGGRNKTTEIHKFFSTILKYSPTSVSWATEGNLLLNEQPYPISAGTGLAYGENQILLFGGDPGIYFNQTERFNNRLAEKLTDTFREAITREKVHLLTNHPGFSPGILIYDTITGNCQKIGNIAGDSPVTTTVFKWNDMFIIPSGETKPGIRTPQVLALRIF